MLESTVFFMCFVISHINELGFSISPWKAGRRVYFSHFMNTNQLACHDHLGQENNHSCLLNARARLKPL